ncbi:hypothetical protein PR202_gb22604 [Eleusine coracana subsp. coracana]|uniref:non-specific serine/threonine protein kinase n=1 Tax=Eleusine coracana subsp. coracana TaxID=191504 RepID=A0AAV5FE80_ELECO|nr:hypothetical protein PR202_gb22604 [Eleusine coracana subsp. coracana]
MAASTINFLNLPLLIFSILLLCRRSLAAGTPSDTLYNGGNITDGETLKSTDGSFTLGFFCPPGAPTKRYLGIWFTASGADSLYWVANRDTPFNNTSGMLVLRTDGILGLLDGSGRTASAWSASDPTVAQAQLLDSGNLVVREMSSGRTLWQSFDDPANTMLAGMKLGKNSRTGENWSLTSWRSQSDPAKGSYSQVMDTKGLPDIVTYWHDKVKKCRAGPVEQSLVSGIPELDSDFKQFSVQMVNNADEVSYYYILDTTTAGSSTYIRTILDEAGAVKVLVWIPSVSVWRSYPWLPRDVCDDYASCGVFGLCNIASTAFCGCVEGFSPVNQSEWSRREYSGGCRRDVRQRDDDVDRRVHGAAKREAP